jgi:hypothetical protein
LDGGSALDSSFDRETAAERRLALGKLIGGAPLEGDLTVTALTLLRRVRAMIKKISRPMINSSVSHIVEELSLQ